MAAAGPATARELPDFVDLVERNRAAVVNISVVRAENRNRSSQRDYLEDFFRRFMPQPGNPPNNNNSPPNQPPPARPLGSGFVISEDGHVVTNHHVVERASRVTVRFSDRRELEAEIIGTDERSDIALLKVKANDLPAVRLGRSENLKVGQWVVAIGSPFGLDHSVTQGIVSAISRSLPSENYVPYIQTDVAINPGNSGGPLFNLKGEVIGINSQIYSRTGSYAGVSFAIPIDVAMNVIAQLRESGRVARGVLGVIIQDVTRNRAEEEGLDKPSGALVTGLYQESPADKAGIMVDDIILSFNGKEIDLSSDLPYEVGGLKPGTEVVLRVLRDGKHKKIKVVLGDLDDGILPSSPDSNERRTIDNLGIGIAQLSQDAQKRLEEAGIEGGVQVTGIASRSPAATAGILRGDIILSINNQRIDSTQSFRNALKTASPGKRVPVLIFRQGRSLFLALRIPDE